MLSALVGWLTNVLAVWMTFNPLEFWPLELLRADGQPWGLFGWQGIIPTKAGVMTAMLYDAFMQKVLDVQEIFSRIDPQKVSELTAAEMQVCIPMMSPMQRSSHLRLLHGKQTTLSRQFICITLCNISIACPASCN